MSQFFVPVFNGTVVDVGYKMSNEILFSFKVNAINVNFMSIGVY